MSERHKPHNGRDRSGHFRVKRESMDELQTDPRGPDFIEDDVRLGGAIEDTGVNAGRHGERIERLIDENRSQVKRLRDTDSG